MSLRLLFCLLLVVGCEEEEEKPPERTHITVLHEKTITCRSREEHTVDVDHPFRMTEVRDVESGHEIPTVVFEGSIYFACSPGYDYQVNWFEVRAVD